MMEKLFLGIDPGEVKGGLGIVDDQGRYVLAERWNRKDPRATFSILYKYRDNIGVVYLEDVNMPQNPGAGLDNRFSGGSNLLVNLGTWQGFLVALDLPYVLIPPATWQAAAGLHRWKKQHAINPAAPCPLSRARELFPAAPLQYKADDGKAVGLLLAHLAHQDHIRAIDRQAIRDHNQTKAKIRKQKLRAARATTNPSFLIPQEDFPW